MKEAEILEKEKNHLKEPDGYKTIHLYSQGTFLRAYNYSAFLLNRYSSAEIKSTNAPSKMGLKVFNGFPAASTEKFLNIEGAVRKPVPEGLDVVLPDSVFKSDENIDTLSEDSDNWFKCIPSSSPSPKQANIELPTGTLLSAVTELLHYPVEHHSLLENTEFLINIRQKLIKLL